VTTHTPKIGSSILLPVGRPADNRFFRPGLFTFEPGDFIAHLLNIACLTLISRIVDFAGRIHPAMRFLRYLDGFNLVVRPTRNLKLKYLEQR